MYILVMDENVTTQQDYNSWYFQKLLRYLIILKIFTKLILEIFIWLVGYIIQAGYFTINSKSILALTKLKVVIISCIVFSHNKFFIP